jgi:hypothetical protein
MYHKIQIKFDYGEIDIYRSWILEKVDLVITDTYPRIPNFEWGNDRNETCCVIFKVPLNQIFSNFNTMLYTIKYRSSLIMVYHER